MSVTAPQQNVTYSQLVNQLRQKPIHVARSFKADDKLNGNGALNPSLIIPETGIAEVDTFTGKANSAIDLTFDSATDIPKAAFKGAFSGGVAGALAGLIAWVASSRKGWVAVALMGGFGVVGAVMGSLFTTAREMTHKANEMKHIVFD